MKPAFGSSRAERAIHGYRYVQPLRPCEQPNTVAVTPGHQPIAIVLDFVQPARASGRLGDAIGVLGLDQGSGPWLAGTSAMLAGREAWHQS